jgi:predicted nucleic acid-binding protein
LAETDGEDSGRGDQVIQLDTSFLIRALVAGSAEDARVRAWLLRGEQLALSAVAWAEFSCGPLPARGAEFATVLLGEALPLTMADAESAADMFTKAGRRGTLADCMIAAVAVRCGARLATSSPRDFERLQVYGLELSDRA